MGNENVLSLEKEKNMVVEINKSLNKQNDILFEEVLLRLREYSSSIHMLNEKVPTLQIENDWIQRVDEKIQSLERNHSTAPSSDEEFSSLQKENEIFSELQQAIATLPMNSESIERIINDYSVRLESEVMGHKLTKSNFSIAMTQYETLLKIIDDLRDQIDILPSLVQWQKVKEGFLSLKERYDALVKKEEESNQTKSLETNMGNKLNLQDRVKALALKGIAVLDEEGINIPGSKGSIGRVNKVGRPLSTNKELLNFLEMDGRKAEPARITEIMKGAEEVLKERKLMTDKYMDVVLRD